MINFIIANDLHELTHVEHEAVHSIVYDGATSTQLTELLIDIIQNNDIQQPKVILTTGRYNLRPENYPTTHENFDWNILNSIDASIFIPVERLYREIHSRNGILQLGTIIPNPKNHCPRDTIHNMEITSVLRQYLDEINKKITKFNQRNNIENLNLHRYVQPDNIRPSELAILRPCFKEDKYTLNKDTCKKIAAISLKSILNDITIKRGKRPRSIIVDPRKNDTDRHLQTSSTKSEATNFPIKEQNETSDDITPSTSPYRKKIRSRAEEQNEDITSTTYLD